MDAPLQKYVLLSGSMQPPPPPKAEGTLPTGMQTCLQRSRSLQGIDIVTYYCIKCLNVTSPVILAEEDSPFVFKLRFMF